MIFEKSLVDLQKLRSCCLHYFFAFFFEVSVKSVALFSVEGILIDVFDFFTAAAACA